MNNKYSVSGKSVTIILKGFFSCKKIMRIMKDFSSLLLVTKYNAIVSREKTKFVTYTVFKCTTKQSAQRMKIPRINYTMNYF